MVLEFMWKCTTPPVSIRSCSVALNVYLVYTAIKIVMTPQVLCICRNLHYLGRFPKWTSSASCKPDSHVNAFSNAFCTILMRSMGQVGKASFELFPNQTPQQGHRRPIRPVLISHPAFPKASLQITCLLH